MTMTVPANKNGLLFAGFNQDNGCFACGTDKGFIIYNCDPLKERFHREFEDGGIGIVEMLFRCNILALVGGGKNPKYPPNKVMIWDDFQDKCIAELEFRSEVKAVRLRRDRIVVVLENKVYVYNFADLSLIDQIDTIKNSHGLCALCPSTTNTVLACPGINPGFVHVELYDVKQPRQRATNIITAHNNPLSQLALNLEGTILATASEKGTLIRLFDTTTGRQLRELRRGVDRAEIYSIAFSPNSSWLGVSSDKGTVHIYSLLGISDPNAQAPQPNNSNPGNNQQVSNRQSRMVFMKDIFSYWGSEWSLAQFRVPGPGCHCVCAFGTDKNSVIVVCSTGEFFKYQFDPVKGGEAVQAGYARFLKEEE